MQLFERPRGGERAVLVHLDVGRRGGSDELAEFRELVLSAGAEPVAEITGSRRVPDAKYFVGAGKAEEIHRIAADTKADVIIFDHSLTPGQERNLEKLTQCRVLDRTGLILDIFAQRARSFEGKLQVELAQLRYLASRLVRGWTHLERQKGGIGLRGPGETQLETDRRLIGHRIKQLNRRLEKVDRQREGQRRARRRSTLLSASLVGYTNAGKSTLFNRLTGAHVYAADQLFATLDPTLRRVEIDGADPVIVADTVGFIRHLPHNLVAAFRATLDETRDAGVLIHVVDASDAERDQRIEQVNAVLDEIGAAGVPQLMVYNKLDRLDGQRPRVDRDSRGRPLRVWLSAKTGEGMDLLYSVLAEFSQAYREGLQAAASDDESTTLVLPQFKAWYRLRLAPRAGKLRAELYERGVVGDEFATAEGGWLLDVELYPDDATKVLHEDGCKLVEKLRHAETA